MVLSTNMLAQLGLELENEVLCRMRPNQKGNGGRSYGRYLVVGQYTGQASMEGDPVLLGLSALLAAEERLALEPAYSVAEFVLDPVKNRELSALAGGIERAGGTTQCGCPGPDPGTVG